MQSRIGGYRIGIESVQGRYRLGTESVQVPAREKASPSKIGPSSGFDIFLA